MLVLTLLGPLWAPLLQAEVMAVIACWCVGAGGTKTQAVRIIGVEAIFPSIRGVSHVPEVIPQPGGGYQYLKDIPGVAGALGDSTFERKVLSTAVMGCLSTAL